MADTDKVQAQAVTIETVVDSFFHLVKTTAPFFYGAATVFVLVFLYLFLKWIVLFVFGSLAFSTTSALLLAEHNKMRKSHK